MAIEVTVAVGVSVGVLVAVSVGGADGVSVAVAVSVAVEVCVAVGADVLVAIAVEVLLAVAVGVLVAGGTWVWVAVAVLLGGGGDVCVAVAVSIAVDVLTAVGLLVGGEVRVGVGAGALSESPHATKPLTISKQTNPWLTTRKRVRDRLIKQLLAYIYLQSGVDTARASSPQPPSGGPARRVPLQSTSLGVRGLRDDAIGPCTGTIHLPARASGH